MKLILITLFTLFTTITLAQNLDTVNFKSKEVDITITLKEYQLENLSILEKEILEVRKILEAKQEAQRQFLNGILSTIGEPSKLRWEFKEPNKLIIKK